MLTHIYDAPMEGNVCNDRGKAIMLQIVLDYNHHMGYVDKGDRKANMCTWYLACLNALEKRKSPEPVRNGPQFLS